MDNFIGKIQEAAKLTEEIDWGGTSVGDVNIKRTTNKPSWTVTDLIKSVHSGLPNPLTQFAECSVINGEYFYFHYGCDGQDDRGWGCGYRTIQTIASWLYCNWSSNESHRCKPPPSLPDIQQSLVSIGDKPGSFSPSREWIGTFEASLVLDYFYNVSCKVVHVRGGGEELEKVAVKELHQHFQKHGSPVMMGGDRDNSSKGILGVCTGDNGSYLLVVDPHYYGCPLEKEELQRQGWVAWKRVSSLDQCSFYNLCLPQSNPHGCNVMDNML